MEKLIELADKGFTVASARGARDLSDPDDRFILRIEVAHAARSSEDTSRRIKRRQQQFREEFRSTGEWPGFGLPRRNPHWTQAPGRGVPGPRSTMRGAGPSGRPIREAVAGMLGKTASQNRIAQTCADNL